MALSLRRIEAGLYEHGLALRAVVRLTDADREQCGLAAQSLALVGNVGASMWPHFCVSSQYSDGLPDPLDRWSRQVADAISDQFSVAAIFPFSGPPWYPFQQWAIRGEELAQSPLGILIHPRYGLWHAYRFALLLDQDFSAEHQETSAPCTQCTVQPCLGACPVKAFDGVNFAYQACREYLRSNSESECCKQGCQARCACPVGREYQYSTEQHQFHLRAFFRP